jgi:hypothetical protein
LTEVSDIAVVIGLDFFSGFFVTGWVSLSPDTPRKRTFLRSAGIDDKGQRVDWYFSRSGVDFFETREAAESALKAWRKQEKIGDA